MMQRFPGPGHGRHLLRLGNFGSFPVAEEARYAVIDVINVDCSGNRKRYVAGHEKPRMKRLNNFDTQVFEVVCRRFPAVWMILVKNVVEALDRNGHGPLI